MKQKIYIFGLITVLIVFAGLTFKINHLAGAEKLLIIGLAAFVLLFMPLALRDHYRAEGNRQKLPLYIATYITCFFVFTSMLFKMMHMPYAGIMLLIALPFPYVVFLPVFLTVTAKNRNFNIYNTVFVLLLLVINSVLSAMLALNVSKDRIENSYSLSKNYNNLETAIINMPESTSNSALNMKIDEIMEFVNEYQSIILNSEELTEEKWENSPGDLIRPDSRGRAVQELKKAGDISGGARLYTSLKSLVREMENTSVYKELAKTAPEIFDLEEPSGNDENWPSWKFGENSLAWILIYLDGLETNLKLIKATIK